MPTKTLTRDHREIVQQAWALREECLRRLQVLQRTIDALDRAFVGEPVLVRQLEDE